MASSTKKRQNAAQKIMTDNGATKASRRGRAKMGRTTQRVYQMRSPNKRSASERRRASRLRARRGRIKAIMLGKFNPRGDGKKHASNKWRNANNNIARTIYGSDRYNEMPLQVMRHGYTGRRRYAYLRNTTACIGSDCGPSRTERVSDLLSPETVDLEHLVAASTGGQSWMFVAHAGSMLASVSIVTLACVLLQNHSVA